MLVDSTTQSKDRDWYIGSRTKHNDTVHTRKYLNQKEIYGQKSKNIKQYSIEQEPQNKKK